MSKRVRVGGWGCPLTYREIGRIFGITKARVEQIHNRALRKLRRNQEVRKLAAGLGILTKTSSYD